jgi:hypothetical protein
MPMVKCTLYVTCMFIDLQKCLWKRRTVKRIKKVNGVVYLRAEVVVLVWYCTNSVKLEMLWLLKNSNSLQFGMEDNIMLSMIS